jgi:hypothetical protein
MDFQRLISQYVFILIFILFNPDGAHFPKHVSVMFRASPRLSGAVPPFLLGGRSLSTSGEGEGGEAYFY